MSVSFDSFLSLGFGRPQCSPFESVDVQPFLNTRLSSPLPPPGAIATASLCGDTYIAATAQLAHIGRTLVSWTEEQEAAELPADQSLLSMLTDLNHRLDEWCKLWIWSGQ